MYKANDHYSQRARQQGYAARSVFKLQEIQQRWHLIRRGSQVVELGAAPGSWSKYVLQQLGAEGKLLAVDQYPITVTDPRLIFYQEDLCSETLRLKLQQHAPFDLLLSDAAPATSGNRLVDTSRSTALVTTAVNLGLSMLRTGGHLVVKIFEGEDTRQLRQRIRENFAACHSLRPKAVREASCEVYLIGIQRVVPA